MKPAPLGVLEAPGALQMRVDEALLAARPQVPLVRVGVWSPPAVSIGYRQAPEGPLSPERLSSRGLMVVRRPTGGLTILHERGSLTVHLAAPRSLVDGCGGVDYAGLLLARWMAGALRMLGYEVYTWPSPPGRRRMVSSPTSICMAYTGSSDILVGGRKAGAGALRVTGTSILFQAVILGAEPDYDEWAWVDGYPDPGELREAFTSLGGPVDPGRLVRALSETPISLEECGNPA